jgi:hypothetical protein
MLRYYLGQRTRGATYRHYMQRCLHDQIGRNVEAYVNDTVVKLAKADLIKHA